MRFLKLKDPGSALTHFAAFVLAFIAAFPLLIKAAGAGRLNFTAELIFIASMTLLYAASTLYHSLNISPKVNALLRRIDHMMIFVMIAGSYTPVCLLIIGDTGGKWLLIAVWSFAALGIILKSFWINCPKYISSLIYISMGWLCITALSDIRAALGREDFAWLLTGGIIYTLGGIIYALKLPVFNRLHKNFGSHEIFHLFVMAGSFCHYALMYIHAA